MAVVWISTRGSVNAGLWFAAFLGAALPACNKQEPKSARVERVRIPVCVAHAHETDPLRRQRGTNVRGATLDLERGAKAIKERRYQEAVQFLQRAVARDPERGLAHLSLAEALLYTGGEGATRGHHLAWAVQLMPQNPRAHLRYAEHLRADGHPTAARKQVRCALERRPTYAKAHRLAAELDLQAGRLADAEQAARAAARAKPSDHRNWVLLGEILDARGAHAAAAQATLTAADTVGRSAPLYRRAARMFKAAAEHDAAAAALARADAIDPPPEVRRFRPLPRARSRRPSKP